MQQISMLFQDVVISRESLLQGGRKIRCGGKGCFFLSRKLQGSNITDIKDRAMARKMSCAMARLHRAFRECEKEIAFWDNSLLDEMKGWVGDHLKSKNPDCDSLFTAHAYNET